MHGDHCQEAPHLKEKWGAQIWTMDRVAAKCRYPERYDYAAPINAYGKGFDYVGFDRILRDGETFEWEGYSLTVDWMPGQTEFALCLHGQIDGRLMAFTGDNLFGSTVDPAQTGHEAVVAHNSGILEEGYLYAANYLHGLQPDIILGGHSWVMDKPREMIERYRQGALDLRRAFQSLSTDEDYRYIFDPYWVRAEPYRVSVPVGGRGECVVWIRNFRERVQKYRIVVHTPAGVTATPAVLEGTSPAESTVRVPLEFKAALNAPQGVQIAAFDVTLDGQRYGEWFDVILQVGDKGAPPPPKGSGEKGNAY
jgi:glyoxylase-like metal-dependent hydrolase (beta-lactamase superfamily II)